MQIKSLKSCLTYEHLGCKDHERLMNTKAILDLIALLTPVSQHLGKHSTTTPINLRKILMLPATSTNTNRSRPPESIEQN